MLLFGANLWLKLPRISEQGLWFDEAVSLGHVQGRLDLAGSLASDASAPLYDLLLYAWSFPFGPSLEAARVLSVLLSAATAVGLFLFGRRFLDAKTGLFAALLFSFSRTQIYYGHEARAYALVGFLCLASFWAFLALLERPGRGRMLAAALFSAALVYAHYVAVFALFAQLVAAALLVRWRSQEMRAYVVSQLLAAALFAPCALYLLASWPLPMASWIRPPVPADVLYVLEAFSGGPLLLGALVVLVGAAVVRSASRTERDRVTVLLLWTTAPLALDYAFSFAVPSFLYRYLLYASLGLFLLAAHGLARLPVGDAVRWTALAVLLVPAAWSVRANPILRPDWRGAAHIALEERADGTITIVTPPYQLLPFAYHYSRDAFATRDEMAAALRARGVHALPTLDGLARATGGSQARVVVVSATDVPDSSGDIDAQMSAEDYRIVRREELTGVRVRVFEKS